MHLSIDINLANDEAQSDPSFVSLYLKEIGFSFENVNFKIAPMAEPMAVRDGNGNKIGEWQVSENDRRTKALIEGAALLIRIQTALGTFATGDDLVRVAREAHRAEETLALIHKEHEASSGKPKDAPGLLYPSFWFIASGNISTTKLDIALFDRDKEHAIASATRMTKSLHAAGYYLFSVCDATGSKLLASISVKQPPIEANVTEGEAQ